MEKASLQQKYQEELAAIHERIDALLDNLHDALLRIGPYSVKDTVTAIIKLEDEARTLQIYLNALNR